MKHVSGFMFAVIFMMANLSMAGSELPQGVPSVGIKTLVVYGAFDGQYPDKYEGTDYKSFGALLRLKFRRLENFRLVARVNAWGLKANDSALQLNVGGEYVFHAKWEQDELPDGRTQPAQDTTSRFSSSGVQAHSGISFELATKRVASSVSLFGYQYDISSPVFTMAEYAKWYYGIDVRWTDFTSVGGGAFPFHWYEIKASYMVNDQWEVAFAFDHLVGKRLHYLWWSVTGSWQERFENTEEEDFLYSVWQGTETWKRMHVKPRNRYASVSTRFGVQLGRNPMPSFSFVPYAALRFDHYDEARRADTDAAWATNTLAYGLGFNVSYLQRRGYINVEYLRISRTDAPNHKPDPWDKESQGGYYFRIAASFGF